MRARAPCGLYNPRVGDVDTWRGGSSLLSHAALMLTFAVCTSVSTCTPRGPRLTFGQGFSRSRAQVDGGKSAKQRGVILDLIVIARRAIVIVHEHGTMFALSAPEAAAVNTPDLLLVALT